MLNLFIAIIVNSLQHLHDQEQAATRGVVVEAAHEVRDIGHDERTALAAQIAAMRRELQDLRTAIAAAGRPPERKSDD